MNLILKFTAKLEVYDEIDENLKKRILKKATAPDKETILNTLISEIQTYNDYKEDMPFYFMNNFVEELTKK